MPLRRFLREPLLHFVAIGAFLFLASAWVNRRAPAATASASRSAEAPPRSPESSRIVVTGDVKRLLVEEFTRAYGHAPTASETSTLVEGWVDEEVLYREGIARGFERDDPGIRHRVAQQMSFVLESAAVPAEPDDATQRAWFAAHPERWAKAELVDFTQVFVQGSDVAASERATALLTQLRAGADPSGLGDVFPGGRRYRRRQIEDLVASFGPDFAKALGEQKEGTWEMRRSRFGQHLVRVDGRSAAVAPTFEGVRDEVKYDWKKNKRAELHKAGIAGLRKRWTVEGTP